MNDGPDAVTIAQVTVDDAYWAFTTERSRLTHLGRTNVHVPYPWVAGEAHIVKILTSTGTPFEHAIAVAVETPKATARHLAAFALIGLYVGVLPVALGLCWFPVLARLGRSGLDVLLAALIAQIVHFEPAEGLRPEGMPPVERLKIERVTLAADGIHLAVMNDGPDAVTIAQVTVDDAYWAFGLGPRAAHRDRDRPSQLR